MTRNFIWRIERGMSAVQLMLEEQERLAPEAEEL
jgi:hypothetical protein